MKHQALFSSKGKSKKIKVSSAAVLFGSPRVKMVHNVIGTTANVCNFFKRKWKILYKCNLYWCLAVLTKNIACNFIGCIKKKTHSKTNIYRAC